MGTLHISIPAIIQAMSAQEVYDTLTEAQRAELLPLLQPPRVTPGVAEMLAEIDRQRRERLIARGEKMLREIGWK